MLMVLVNANALLTSFITGPNAQLAQVDLRMLMVLVNVNALLTSFITGPNAQLAQVVLLMLMVLVIVHELLALRMTGLMFVHIIPSQYFDTFPIFQITYLKPST